MTVPLAAATSALAALACCLPVAFAAGTAAAGLAAVAGEYRSAFLGASGLLLVVGVVQVARAPRACRRDPASVVMLAAAAGIVLAVLLFPQAVATVLADFLP